MKTFFLIDANSLIYRCFHALPPFTAPSGRPTGALYGLASILLKIWREGKPDYAAALFDRPEPTFRKEIYPEYKAQRPRAPDELISQIIEARTLFQKFGIKVLEKPGAEADDLIATLSQKFTGEPDLNITILTSDMDTLQLVKGEKIKVKALKKGISETAIYDEKAVEERYGLKPEQMIDYKVLVGDASDNIKGVGGIGPKTATALLRKFGSLKNIYENLESIPRAGEKLEKVREQTEKSRKLIALDRNVDLKISHLPDFKIKKENERELREYFREMGFKTILERMDGAIRKKDSATGGKSSQGRIFG